MNLNSAGEIIYVASVWQDIAFLLSSRAQSIAGLVIGVDGASALS
jgi:hypothetical protein